MIQGRKNCCRGQSVNGNAVVIRFYRLLARSKRSCTLLRMFFQQADNRLGGRGGGGGILGGDEDTVDGVEIIPEGPVDGILEIETFRIHRGEAAFWTGELDPVIHLLEDVPRMGDLGKEVTGPLPGIAQLAMVGHDDKDGALFRSLRAGGESGNQANQQ